MKPYIFAACVVSLSITINVEFRNALRRCSSSPTLNRTLYFNYVVCKPGLDDLLIVYELWAFILNKAYIKQEHTFHYACCARLGSF